MAQGINGWPLTKTEIRSQAILCESRGVKIAVGQAVLPVLPFSPVDIIPPMLHTHLHLHVSLTRRTTERSLRTFQKGNALS